MRIGIVTASVSRHAGGLYDAVRRLALEMAALTGSSIQVFGIKDSSTAADLSGWQGLPINVARVRGPRLFGYSPDLLGSVGTADLDLVHQHGIWMYPSIVCRSWSVREQRPYIVTPHGMLDAWAIGNSRWKKRLAGWFYENRNLRGAACLHALCESEARAFRAYGLKNPVCVIPNGIDLPSSLDAPPPDWENGETRGAKVLLYLGRLHPKKNLLNLIRAWSAAYGSNYCSCDWRLVIAGWDQNGYQGELERAAGDLGIRASVRFVGPQFGEAKHTTLCRANAFILPSLSEGLPMAVLEAWAYGLPVLMTPQCNLPEGFAARAAARIDPKPESIAEELAALFGMRDTQREAMGAHGRKLVRERFSWADIARQMQSVYEWCIGGGPQPHCVVP
jgi:poly(glycerol-phosphate) alpha-glucosyltransferase